MHRCPSPPGPGARPRLPALALCCAALLAAAALPTQAQAPVAAGQRTFPAAAERGTLKIVNRNEAVLDGKPVRLAPGLRLFNQKNALVFAHQLAGQSHAVSYVMEPSTGRLHTAWLLTPAEAKREPKAAASAPAPGALQ